MIKKALRKFLLDLLKEDVKDISEEQKTKMEKLTSDYETIFGYNENIAIKGDKK